MDEAFFLFVIHAFANFCLLFRGRSFAFLVPLLKLSFRGILGNHFWEYFGIFLKSNFGIFNFGAVKSGACAHWAERVRASRARGGDGVGGPPGLPRGAERRAFPLPALPQNYRVVGRR